MSATTSITQHDRRQPEAIKRRLLARIKKTDAGCWEWTGAKCYAGYGKMYANRKARDTHRIAYEVFCGPIPDGMYVCHRCDNPPCVNPEHLFLGTPKANQQDMRDKGRAVHLKGEAKSSAGLTDADVLRLRKMFGGGVKRSEIATTFGLDETTVTHIATGKIWKHLPGAVPPRVYPPKISDVSEARRLRSEGASYTAIGRKFGVSPETVRRTLLRNQREAHHDCEA